MRPHSGKHPNHIESDASNLITVPITPYNGTAVQNVSIGLINCQSICNKSGEISDVVKDMDLDVLVITETLPTDFYIWGHKCSCSYYLPITPH